MSEQVGSIGSLQCVVLDCPDPRALARFYQGLIGGEVDRADRRWSLGDDWSTLHTGSGLVLAFQQVGDYRPPRWPDQAAPQQFHLDIGVGDLDAAEARVFELGAVSLDDRDGKRSWRVYADPAGHPFCLVRE
ncbi:VOC family protein [Streptomyces sp. NPDC002577]